MVELASMHESKTRSLVKALTWRVVASTDTVVLALIFTGSAAAALSIGALELLTKTLWYYLHERVWLRVRAPHTPKRLEALEEELSYGGHARSLLKAVTWRMVGSLDTFVLSLIVTGRALASTSIGGTELLTKSLLYYLHERFWLHVRWGLPKKEFVPPASRLEHLGHTLRRYYHMLAALAYGALTLLALVACAGIIYAAHAYL